MNALKKPVSVDVPPDESVLWLKVQLRSEHRREVLAHDFGSVVSAVGGSLGLFLGVSCLSTLTLAVRRMARSCDDGRKEDREAAANGGSHVKAWRAQPQPPQVEPY